jgi:selenide,water dikinase
MMATAMKRGVLAEEHYGPLVKQLTTLNSIGAHLGRIQGVHAMTDVTGFGVLGHSTEMAEGSGVTIELHYNNLLRTAGVEDYLEKKTIPGATPRNWSSYSHGVQFEEGVNVEEAFNLLPDPQTNGGLLIAVAPEAVEEVKALFIKHGLEKHTTPIGRCIARGEKNLIVLP